MSSIIKLLEELVLSAQGLGQKQHVTEENRYL